MRALLVDDQNAVRTALAVLLDLHGIQCFEAASPAEALDLVRQEDVGVVIQDMNFSKDTTSGEEGVELFRTIHELDPDLPVILLTAWSSLETAVALIKEGAADYVSKPWDDQKLLLTVQNLIRLRKASFEARRLNNRDALARRETARRFDLCGLLYQSSAMQETVSLATHIAASDAAVLITGPNGSGKENLAEIVQANSRRRDRPFVKVNAGGLPDQLLEAELFGAEAGAFTGATKQRIGRFEAANGGTLFLDELGNLSSSGQMKLLRVLQTGEFQRLGSSKTQHVDVRLISATNADLKAEIAAGNFREDLYFRLNVIELAVPALCRRPEDIQLLSEHFLSEHGQDSSAGFSRAALRALERHDWPGNVRELMNRIHRAVLVSQGGTIEPAHLGLEDSEQSSPNLAHDSNTPAVDGSPSARNAAEKPAADAAGSALDVAERAVIEQAIERASGVISRAAGDLGLSRQALYRRMVRLGIRVERRLR